MPDRFASKAGGEPVWLYRYPCTGARTPRCSGCGEAEKYLCQIYAPVEEGSIEHDGAFHRVLYVTICTSSGCTFRRDGVGATVLRGQLKRDNQFYAYTVREKGEEDVAPVQHACILCGFWGELFCGGCHSVRYCSKRCQREDWSLGHRDACKNRNTISENEGNDQHVEKSKLIEIARKQWLFAELEILTDRHCTPPQSDSEDGDTDDDRDDQESTKIEAKQEHKNGETQSRISKTCIQDVERVGKTVTPRGTMQDAGADELPEELFQGVAKRAPRDPVQRRFHRVIAYEPDQVVRYERNGQPLWANPRQQCDGNTVSRCEKCGSRRIFEMQIMPQIVYKLELERREQDTRLATPGHSDEQRGNNIGGGNRMTEVAKRLKTDMDWATIVVWTCEKSCELEIGEYAKESAWVQRHT